MTVALGYLLPTRERVMAGEPAAAPLLALAERAEALGYDSVWAGDSPLARPRHEPLTLLAAAAGRTRRVVLGTAVLLPALRNPVLLAHQAATLDRISEGRLILGVGIASDAPNVRAEFAAAGVPFEKRVGRLLEGLRVEGRKSLRMGGDAEPGGIERKLAESQRGAVGCGRWWRLVGRTEVFANPGGFGACKGKKR